MILRCIWLGLFAILGLTLASCGGGSAGEAGASPAALAESQPADTRKSAAAVGAAGDPSALNGWYWNPLEPGTGFMFEAQGNRGFVGFFMYEQGTGKPIWYAAYGDVVPAAAGGEFAFTGDLRLYQGGQALSSAIAIGPTSTSIGQVVLGFAGGRAKVVLPSGRGIDAQRYVIDNSGYDFANPVPTRRSQPEVGWYWNPAEGGRGYAIEVQNDKVFMAMFHYNPDGSPTWNVAQGDIATGSAVLPFEAYSGGQSLTSSYRAPAREQLALLAFSFRNTCAGQLQVVDMPAIAVRRFRIDGTNRALGAECNAVGDGILSSAPGLNKAGLLMEPGDAVFGKIGIAGELYTYGYNVRVGKNYTVAMEGVYAGTGSLLNPLLSVYDSNLLKLQVAGPNGVMTFTPTRSGAYYFTAQGLANDTGSYVLTVNGAAFDISTRPAPEVSTYAGAVTGRVSGRTTGAFDLQIGPTGQLAGTLTLGDPPSTTPLTVTGSVAPRGVVTLVASGGGNSLTFSGLLFSGGTLYGGWSDGQGPGGLFLGKRGATPP